MKSFNDDDIALTSTLTPATAEYQIRRKKNNGTYIIVEPWTAGPSIDYTDSGLGVGDYTYEVEYKDPDTECSDIAFFNATVHPTPTVTIQMTHLECSTPYHPYTIELTATGNQSGTYTWSNGMSGPTIVVDHGGPYRVWFKPDGTDCVAMATFQAPKSPDEYTWIFPTGCLEYCVKNMEEPYIVGPLPYFNGGYAYDLDGTTVVSGPGTVPDLPLTYLDGGLSLTLDNGYCDATTDILELSPVKCGPCKIDIVIKNVDKNEDDAGFMYFQLFGHITNPYNFMVTVQLTSPDGVFIPSSINVPPNGVYDFTTIPIDFIPTNNTATIQVQYVVTGNAGNGIEILCSDFLSINLDGPQNKTAGGSGIAQMTVAPNPALSATEVLYTIEDIAEFKGGIIKLYSLTGRLIKAENVNETKGTQTFDLSGLASGAYILVFLHQGERIGQQVLIKE